MEEIQIKSSKRIQFIDITEQLNKIMASKFINEGICVVFTPHTTAAVTINENTDPDLKDDFNAYIQKMFKGAPEFKHSEGNTDSHILSSLFGTSQTIIISEGKLVLGTWQGIYFCEFDGPRKRKLYLQFISS